MGARSLQHSTLSKAEPARSPPPGRRASIIVVLESEQPLHPSTRHVLDEASTLVIGRGADRRLDRSATARGVELRLDLADPWMSVSSPRCMRATPPCRASCRRWPARGCPS